MKYLTLFVIAAGAYLSSASICFSQTPAPTPADRTLVLRRLSEQGRQEAASPRVNEKKPLSPKEKRRIEEAQKPDPAVAEAVADIRKRLGAKLVRLYPDYGCESQHTVSLKADCADRMVGASQHPLRGEGVSADIHYDNGMMIGVGFFNLVLIAPLEDVTFEDVGPQNPTLKALAAFDPPSTFKGATKTYEALTGNGVAVEGVTFTDRIAATIGTTFAIRIIACGTKEMGGFVVPRNAAPEFKDLRWDGRRDVTLVAEVVGSLPDGSIHLLWRELGRKSAPSIRFEDGDPPIDFRQKGRI